MPLYQQEEEARLRQQLSSKAVNLAVQGCWEEAEAVNRSIIEKFPADVEAYNRLGRALTKLGDFVRAREAYLKALEIAPSNAIAKKNLSRLASLPESIVTPDGDRCRVTPELFTIEAGRAGMVKLYNIASPEVLAKISFGDQVRLNVKGGRLVVESEQGDYLGEVESKQALRLIKLIEGGNGYAAAILNIKENEVQVVIKEIYQHPSQMGYLSFPVKAAERLRPYIKESLIGSKISADESGAIEEVEYPEEEDEYSKSEGESLPEGFSVVSENGERGEVET